MTSGNQEWRPDPADGSRVRWWNGAYWTAHVSRDGTVWQEPMAARSRSRRVWWIVAAAALGIILLIAAPSFMVLVAVVVLTTAIFALTKGMPTWLRLGSKRVAGVVAAGAVATLIVSGSVAAAASQGDQAPAARAALTPVEVVEEPDTPPPAARATPSAEPEPVLVVTEETVTEAIPFESSVVDDPSLPAGQVTVTTEGVDGQRSLVYSVTWDGDREVKRELVSDSVTVAPIAKVTANGTYVAPPPPPPPPPAAPAGNCDSNYADACVPIASDVDCAGGSGNGPAYFGGVARVVGSDIYELDRDGDGYACETW